MTRESNRARPQAALSPLNVRKHQRGQAIVLLAFMLIVIIGAVGIAVDTAVGYYFSTSEEKAASAAALAGVPFMPAQYCASSSPTVCGGSPGVSSTCSVSACTGNFAVDRAVREATRNGFDKDAGDGTIVQVLKAGDRELEVHITRPAPVYFMKALGLGNYTVGRTAIAAFRPPIAIGQPGNQLGATNSGLGSGSTNFYFLRMKGWNALRSEGDAFTPNPLDNDETNAPTSKDVHIISATNGQESTATPAPPVSLPAEGGYNFRATVPPGTTGEIQVYNAADSPDFAGTHNTCENLKGVTPCNPSGFYYHEEDGHSQCDQASDNTPTPFCTAAEQNTYQAMVYTLFQVNDVFLRQNDTVLTQTVVLPIDATNYNAATPTYINVNDGSVITQSYTGNLPKNMQVYHSWDAIANDAGLLDSGLLPNGQPGRNLIASRTSNCGNPCVTNGSGTGLGPGSYRLRVDSFNFDASTGHLSLNRNGNCHRQGTCSALPTCPGGQVCYSPTGSHGYAVRLVTPGTDPTVASSSAGALCKDPSGPDKCAIAAWEDMCAYTPIVGGSGVAGLVPLFELPVDYAGSTVDIFVFDLGDANGNVDLALLNPDKNIAKQKVPPQANPPYINGNNAVASISDHTKLLQITNLGVSRLGPAKQHTPPQFGTISGPAGSDLTVGQHSPFQQWEAGEEATTGGNANWQGSWLDFVMPVPNNYEPPLPSTQKDYWQLQYGESTGTAFDTFTLVVTARGGPVHLIQS